MSHINEALKKAQKARDTRLRRYSGMLERNIKRKTSFKRKAVFVCILMLFLILLALTSYSMLDLYILKKPLPIKEGGPSKTEMQVSKKDAQVLYENAFKLFKDGHIKDAQKTYEKLLALDPGHVDALNDLGVLYLREGAYQEAKLHLEKAILLRPSYVEPYYNLACLHAMNGDLKQGIVYLNKSLSLDITVRDWALKDTDLSNLKNTPAFKEMMAMKPVQAETR